MAQDRVCLASIHIIKGACKEAQAFDNISTTFILRRRRLSGLIFVNPPCSSFSPPVNSKFGKDQWNLNTGR
jgi:hypothetical protein